MGIFTKTRSVALVAIAACLCASVVLLAGGVSLAYGDEIDTQSSAQVQLGDDFCWAGGTLDIDGATMENDILAAGKTIEISACEVPGSVRAAGETVSMRNSSIGHSVTLAGKDVRFEGGTAQAVALAGKTAWFNGAADSLSVAADDVVVDGTVHGDVVIKANTVTVGSSAVVEGALRIESSREPSIEEGAVIGDLDLNIDEGKDGASDLLSLGGMTVIGNPSNISVGGVLRSVMWGILTFAVMALLCEWLGRRHTASARETLRTRTGAHIGTGVVAAIVAPVVLIVLCCTVIGLPVAAALAGVLVAVTMAGGGFACASFAPLAFPRMGRWKRVILLAAIVGVCSRLPIVGALITIAGFMYLLGYILQCVFQGIARDKAPASGDTANGVANNVARDIAVAGECC